MPASPPSAFPASLVRRVLAAGAARAGGGLRVLGISGLQGSGKSTLTAQVAAAAQADGLSAARLSLDDVYLTAAQRRALAAGAHPLLSTRGPPGTHDVALALATIDALRAGRTPPLPRFDKLGDDRLPEAHWPRPARPLDLLVLEGWCLGVPPESDAALQAPINALERDEDADGRWRRYCNAALGRDYPGLWSAVDVLCLLQAPGFEVVHRWRWQQEQALRNARAGSEGMAPARFERFIQHFERISRHALRTLPPLADMVVPLDAARGVPGEHP